MAFINPSRLFNCDESGLPLAPKGVKVVAKTGSKVVSSMSSDTKAQITVLGCVCANGTTIPPFIKFDRKTLNPELTTGEVPGTLYGLSRINQEPFLGATSFPVFLLSDYCYWPTIVLMQ